MGAYVNPPPGDENAKDLWLKENAKEVELMSWEDIPEDKSFLVRVDNVIFTAIGIAFDERELEAFTGDDESRPRKFYLADTDKVREVSDLERYLPEIKKDKENEK